MSIVLKRATILDKKNHLHENELNFEATSGSITNIISEDLVKQRRLVETLIGKKPLKMGKLQIDGIDGISRYRARRHYALLQGAKPFSAFLSVRSAMFLSLLTNRRFLVGARNNHIMNKFEYLSYKTAKLNKSDITIRESVDEIVKKFIDSTLSIETQWINEFEIQINKFHTNWIATAYDEYSEHIKILLRDYITLSERTWCNEMMEMFLESLWDKVYSFLDIVSSCHCEYNAKISKKREIRKLSKELNFTQHNYVVKKYLKVIELKINDLKRIIFKDRVSLRIFRKRNENELVAANQKNRKDVKLELAKWTKLTIDQRAEFLEKQEQIIFNNLLDESLNIKGKIVEIFHAYHQKVLAGAIESISIDEAKIMQRDLKAKVYSVRQQARKWINTEMTTLGIGNSDDVNSKQNRQPHLNYIYFRLLQAHYFKRENIIFNNIFGALSREDAQKLMSVINILKLENPKLTIIFIEKDYQNLPNLKAQTYLYKGGELNHLMVTEDICSKPDNYIDTIFYKYNKIQFKTVGKTHLIIAGQKIKLSKEIDEEKTALLLNPFLIKSNKNDGKQSIVAYNIKGMKSNSFKDPKMCLGVNNSGNKIYFYNEEQQVPNEIFIPEEAIVKFI